MTIRWQLSPIPPATEADVLPLVLSGRYKSKRHNLRPVTRYVNENEYD